MENSGLTIAINAEISPGGEWGGVQQFVVCLVLALGRLTDGPERYIVVGPQENAEWLRPYLGQNQVLVSRPRIKCSLSGFQRMRAKLGSIKRRVAPQLPDRKDPSPSVPMSDGFFESLDAEVVHFPYQTFVRTELASVFNPHDLQHLHYPQFFTQEQIAAREVAYRAGCEEAVAVVTESQWVKDDLVESYGISPTKVHAVPWGPPTVIYPEVTDAEVTRIRRELDLPNQFALYPAQTWPHKNHIRLMEALSGLDGLPYSDFVVICTGVLNWHWPVIERRRKELGLEQRVRFLGYVDELHLRALYRLCTFVIVPSLFEGGGFPVLEAFAEGAPVAAANTTSIPEYAGGAALLFDPLSVDAISDALSRMVTDEELRKELANLGRRRISRFDWGRTARAYRAIYRLAGGGDMTPEDRELLQDDGWV